MKSYAEIKAEGDGRDDAAAMVSQRARIALGVSVGVTLLLYIVPFGRLIGYPLILLSTLVHELGHGLTAAALGGSFHEFVMFVDASGVAKWSGAFSAGGRALVAAGGLVGPALAGAIGFVCARRPRGARIFLVVMAVGLLLADILVVRNPFGIAFVGVCAVGFGFAAWYDKGSWSQLVLVFLATQLALSVFSRGDYLFMAEAHTGAGVMPSDVSHMAEALGGTYWLWGLVVGTFSLLVLAAGLYVFLRPPSSRPSLASRLFGRRKQKATPKTTSTLNSSPKRV